MPEGIPDSGGRAVHAVMPARRNHRIAAGRWASSVLAKHRERETSRGVARGLAGCDSSRSGRRSMRCRSGGGKAIRTEEHPEKGAHRTKVLQVGKAGGLHGSAVEAISARFTRVLCQRGVAPRLSSWKPGPRMDRATGAPGGRQHATEGRRKCLPLGDAAHSGGSGVVKHRALPARRRWRKSSADVQGNRRDAGGRSSHG